MKPKYLSIERTYIRPNDAYFTRYADCICRCGKKFTTRFGSIKSGLTVSCGCYKREAVRKRAYKHGLCPTKHQSPTYKTWACMKSRCSDPNATHFERYGGRGISVCKRWLEYINFYEDMGERPNGLTLERIDNDKGYSKENCRWATRFDQYRNRCANLWIEFNGEKLVLTDWAKRLGAKPYVLSKRIKLGWPMDKVVSTPLRIRD